jgi:phosphate transport system protein
MVDRRFDEELTQLNSQLLKMASLTQESIYLAIESLKQRDINIAIKVIDMDKKIDDFEVNTEDQTIELLVRRQPMAVDLRFITTGMRLNSELERIADLAVNIAQRSIDLCKQDVLKPLIDIPRLSELAIKMVKETIDSFVKRDPGLALNVIKMDKEANDLRNHIHEDLVENYMKKNPDTISRAVSLFLVAQHLERICDHAKYIAEDVIYLVNAKNIKHSKRKV